MTKNPVINALAAILYIIIVATTMFYGTNHVPGKDSVFAPIAIMSLFTLSAAVMGYLFLGQPLQLYLDDKKKEAVNLFIQTVAIFAVLTAVILIVYFSGVRF